MYIESNTLLSMKNSINEIDSLWKYVMQVCFNELAYFDSNVWHKVVSKQIKSKVWHSIETVNEISEPLSIRYEGENCDK